MVSKSHGQTISRKITTPRGFMLIELLVVISVIGLLASTFVVTFSALRETARDTVRISQLRIFRDALALYYAEHGAYPDTGMVWRESCGDPNYIPGLAPDFIAQLPTDPSNCMPAKYSAELHHYGYISDGNSYVVAAHPETRSWRFAEFFDKANDGGVNPCIADNNLITHFIISEGRPGC